MMNRPWSTLLIAIGIIVATLPLKAETEPLNILVGDLTFTRPETWKWEPPAINSIAVAQFVIPGGSEKSRTDIRFYLSDKDANEMKQTWKGFFSESDQLENVEEERLKISQREIVLVKIHGTHAYNKEKPRAGWAVIVVAIPFEKKHVHVRILGPQARVEKAAGDFRKMIEDAVREP